MAEIQNNYGQREITTQTQYLPHNYDINKYNDILESYTDSFLIANTFNSFFFSIVTLSNYNINKKLNNKCLH